MGEISYRKNLWKLSDNTEWLSRYADMVNREDREHFEALSGARAYTSYFPAASGRVFSQRDSGNGAAGSFRLSSQRPVSGRGTGFGYGYGYGYGIGSGIFERSFRYGNSSSRTVIGSGTGEMTYGMNLELGACALGYGIGLL